MNKEKKDEKKEKKEKNEKKSIALVLATEIVYMREKSLGHLYNE